MNPFVRALVSTCRVYIVYAIARLRVRAYVNRMIDTLVLILRVPVESITYSLRAIDFSFSFFSSWKKSCAACTDSRAR